ncbi:21970_t:CDS:2 [Cetraspora pellucida]|uniref:21970_t:CDS:1 n=1 Tax=Cetraspora pellucida TaxID=1433469 RepID=A0A9N9HIR5_9GLOM|nr:21970_t:CDS:2 [Cetraspora pellucida]
MEAETKTVTKNNSTWLLSVSIMKKLLFIIMLLCLILQILMVDITSGNNINARDDKQVPPQSKLTESLIQEQNHSVSEDNCELTGECTCKIEECEPCNKLELELVADYYYCKEYGNKVKVICKWNDTSKNDSVQYRSCRRVIKLDRAKYIEFQEDNPVDSIPNP